MNVITFASRKGGVGKSTLTAHISAFAHVSGHRCLIIDADPQGSLTLWHATRPDVGLPLRNAAQGIDRLVASAQIDGVEWVFIDTAPTTWVVVQEAIRVATMVVIPVRPGFFDIAAVQDTVETVRERNKPHVLVINAAPARREQKEAPAVALTRAEFDRLSIPVWSGQISQRTAFVGSLAAGGSAGELHGDPACSIEIAELWSAIQRSVEAINGAGAASADLHGEAA
ncbi:MAG TPA: ParA family protein [Xanthobacteraceae bacterium]|nr:ParA family protein [Xanthobacteraceae bacterium]